MIPPTDTDPWFDIWAATVRAIYAAMGAGTDDLEWWDALTPERKYDHLEGRSAGCDAFIDAYNTRVVRSTLRFFDSRKQ